MLTAKQRKELWKQRGGVLTALAREAGVSINHVRLVLTGERRSPRVEAMVAKVLGVPADVAFPPTPARRRKTAEVA